MYVWFGLDWIDLVWFGFIGRGRGYSMELLRRGGVVKERVYVFCKFLLYGVLFRGCIGFVGMGI